MAKCAGIFIFASVLTMWGLSLVYLIVLPLPGFSLAVCRGIIILYGDGMWHQEDGNSIAIGRCRPGPYQYTRLGLQWPEVQGAQGSLIAPDGQRWIHVSYPPGNVPTGPARVTSRWIVRIPFWMVALPLGLWLAAMLRQELKRRIKPGHCRVCGYNLTGNESGICSECGTKISQIETKKDRANALVLLICLATTPGDFLLNWLFFPNLGADGSLLLLSVVFFISSAALGFVGGRARNWRVTLAGVVGILIAFHLGGGVFETVKFTSTLAAFRRSGEINAILLCNILIVAAAFHWMTAMFGRHPILGSSACGCKLAGKKSDTSPECGTKIVPSYVPERGHT